MRILLYGATGWIGNQFVEYLKSNTDHEVHVGTARLDNDEGVEAEIVASKPTHIASFTGRTHGTYEGVSIPTIDYLEKPGKLTENMRDNLYGPLSLALLAQKHGIHYTYLGTGCIFDYDESHPFESSTTGFKEGDEPNYFGSSYSIVKGFTDRLVHRLPVLNLRIRMPITGEKNPRNFITKIANYAKICSIKNSMSVLPDMYPIVVDMMEKKRIRTVNLTNPGIISHNEILELYKEIVDPAFTWENFTKEEQAKILLASRSNNCLDTSFLETEYPTIPTIHEGVRNMLVQYSCSVTGSK
jgi:3,5-epimerase/4-reductase